MPGFAAEARGDVGALEAVAVLRAPPPLSVAPWQDMMKARERARGAVGKVNGRAWRWQSQPGRHPAAEWIEAGDAGGRGAPKRRFAVSLYPSCWPTRER